MPTDETTLEALAVKWETVAERLATHATGAVIQISTGAAEARLIADALRCKLAHYSITSAELSLEEQNRESD